MIYLRGAGLQCWRFEWYISEGLDFSIGGLSGISEGLDFSVGGLSDISQRGWTSVLEV